MRSKGPINTVSIVPSLGLRYGPGTAGDILTGQESELLRLIVAGNSPSQITAGMRLDEKAFRACVE